MLAAVVAAAAGCAGGPHKPRPAERAPVASVRTVPVRTNEPPAQTLRAEIRGVVTSLNSAGRFVVVRFPVGVMPGPGTLLSAWRGESRVGEIRITGPQRDLLTAADILSGECRPGDTVRTTAP